MRDRRIYTNIYQRRVPLIVTSIVKNNIPLPVIKVRQTTKVIVQKRAPLYLNSLVRNDIVIPIRTKHVRIQRDVIRRAPSYIPSLTIVPIIATKRLNQTRYIPWGRPSVKLLQMTITNANTLLVAPRRVRLYPVYINARKSAASSLFSSTTVNLTNTILVTSTRKVR